MRARDSYLKRPRLGWCVVYLLHSITPSGAVVYHPPFDRSGFLSTDRARHWAYFKIIFIHLYHLWRIGVQCGCTRSPTLHLMGGA